MKDKEGLKEERQEREYDLKDIMDELDSITKQIRRSTIKDCPKCKHPVMAQEDTYLEEVPNIYIRYIDCFRCLACGVKFTCSNECVCRVIDDIV